MATTEASWKQAGQQPEDASRPARSAQEAEWNGEQMSGKTPTQAGIDVGSSVVKNASAQNPVVTLTLILGALLMSGSIWMMYSKIEESRKELLAAINHHETNGHASAVEKIEMTNAVAGLQRSIEKLSEKVDNQTNAINARIDRLIDRNK